MTRADYYARRAALNTDGTPLFVTPEDSRNEDAAVRDLEASWKCQLQPFGPLAPVDYYALRDGRLCAVVEIKTRTHATDKYPTVFLNVRKWLALQLASIGLGVPAIFVVKFTDGLRWVDVAEVDAHRHTMGGTVRIVKARSDIEPVVHVPVASMRSVAGAGT